MRRSAAHLALRAGRLAFAPLAAGLAGPVFVVLLPICGIASIAGAAAKGAWAFAREACAPARGREAPRT